MLKSKASEENNNAGSSVINIGSVAGGCSVAMKSGVVYAMTKAAMSQLTYNLACEWGRENIRVNCVCPWYIRTPLADQVLKDEVYKKTVLDVTPAGRVGEVEEVSRELYEELQTALQMTRNLSNEKEHLKGELSKAKGHGDYSAEQLAVSLEMEKNRVKTVELTVEELRREADARSAELTAAEVQIKESKISKLEACLGHSFFDKLLVRYR